MTLLNGENRFDLIRSFDQQVLGTLLTLWINNILALLFLLCLNWLFELDSVHGCLAETCFVYHFVTFDSVFFRRVAIWNMLKDLTLFLVSHFLILFKCIFSSLLEILLVIMNTNKIINSGLCLNLLLFLQLLKRNFWNELLIFNVKGAWPLVSVVDIKVLELWVSSFEILEMINHNLNKFHLEESASLRLKIGWNRSWVWLNTWFSAKLINLRGILRNGDD